MEFTNNRSQNMCNFCTMNFDEDYTIPTPYGICELCLYTTPEPLMQAWRVFTEHLRPTGRVGISMITSGKTYHFSWCDIRGSWLRFHDMDTERMTHVHFSEIAEIWEE